MPGNGVGLFSKEKTKEKYVRKENICKIKKGSWLQEAKCGKWEGKQTDKQSIQSIYRQNLGALSLSTCTGNVAISNHRLLRFVLLLLATYTHTTCANTARTASHLRPYTVHS